MTLITFFHLIGAISFGFGCYYDWNFVRIPTTVHSMGIPFCGKLKFLTFWDASIQTIFFSLCILVDITKSTSLNKLKNYFHATIAFPLAFIVGVTFWSIYAVDRELIFPRVLDQYFPGWLNHLMHTNIMVFTIIEMFITERTYPRRSKGLKTLILFQLIYVLWMNYIYFKTGYWVYPIFNILNVPLQILFYVVMLAYSVGVYIVGEKLNGFIWSSSSSNHQVKNATKKQS